MRGDWCLVGGRGADFLNFLRFTFPDHALKQPANSHDDITPNRLHCSAGNATIIPASQG
jgi:hypothetical protein